MPKKENIQDMFDSIAPEYDKLNHIMSLDIDKTWRKRAETKPSGDGLGEGDGCGRG